MKRNLFLLVFIVLSGFSVLAQDRTILEIDNEKIEADEFIHIFTKNSKIEGEVSRKDVEDYMNLFVNFKLKVHEGEICKMDTARSFRQEVAGYRKQLAQPYLSDKSVEEELIKEAYERMCYDVETSHILITLGNNATPEDTLKAWNKINAIYKRAISGEDFGLLAKETSEDPSAAKNSGYLGYTTVFGMVYDFETAIYNTPVGTISQPFKTKYGYHIAKIHDKRAAKGKYRVAHIMVVSPQAATAEEKRQAKATIDEVYSQAKSGADFAALADKYSADRRSAMQGGDLGWINVGGRMIKEFETAVFALNNVGDISEIVTTSYGYHVIKLLEKESIKPFDEVKAELKTKISGNMRSYKGRDAVVASLRNEYKIKDMPKTIAPFYKKYVTDSIFEGKWKIDSTLKLNKVIFRIKDREYTEKDFANFILRYNNKQTPVDKKMLMLNAYKFFCDKKILEYEESRLEEKYSTFKYLMKEYHDGILIFALTSKEVWDKASSDTAGLQAFYEKNKENYKWNYRYSVNTYKCKDAKTAEQLSKAFSANINDSLIVKTLQASDSLSVELVESSLEEKGRSLQVDNAIRESGATEDASFTKVMVGDDNVVTTVAVVEPCLKTLSEIKGVVTAGYQDYLEKEWIANLHKKYSVKINDAMIDQVVKELSSK